MRPSLIRLFCLLSVSSWLLAFTPETNAQGLIRPYTGPSGPAQRSETNCQTKLKQIQAPTPNPYGRIVSFVLKAKNKRYAQFGFTGPGVACVAVTHEYYPNQVFGHLLVFYRGGLQLEFPDLNKVVGQGFSEIGDVGTFQSVFLRRANVDVKITDPPPRGQFLIRE